MKSQKSKKRLVVLPEDFAEVLIMHEIKYEKEHIDVDIIRKLIYLYSLGMEYYDSINKYNLYEFYFEKLNKLLLNEKVVEVLDRNTNFSVDFKENNEEDVKLFRTNPYQIVKQGRRSLSEKDLNFVKLTKEDLDYREVLFTEGCDRNNRDDNSCLYLNTEPYNNKSDNNSSYLYSSPIKTTASYRDSKFLSGNKSEHKIICKQIVSEEFSNLDIKLNKITENISRDISEQKMKFEELKKLKLEKQSSGNKTKIKRHLTKSKESEEQMNYSSNPTAVTLTDDDVFSLTKEKVKECMNHSLMLKEIEEYIEANMKEMHAALYELKASFEDEIISVDEEVFAEVVKGLREDMKIELEDLRDQYEEQRRNEVEKIRSKYLKRK